jgi:ketosteroid isomerase-like protein
MPANGQSETLAWMSWENVEVVRQPVAVRTKSRRHLDERLALRFPRALTVLARAVLGLPPRSRLRQACLCRAVRLAYEATNRSDYEAAFALYHPDIELITPAAFESLGTSGLRGREERVRFQRRWNADWGEMRFEPEEINDLGPRVLVIGRIKGSGLSSGAAFENEWANLLTLSGGRVIREQAFIDHGEALEAAGLPE